MGKKKDSINRASAAPVKKQQTVVAAGLAPKPVLDVTKGQELKVVRANFSFMGETPVDKPELDEMRHNSQGIWARHPMDLFTMLQDENPWVDLAVRVIASSCASTMPLFRIEGNKKKKTKIERFTKKLLSPNQQTTGYNLFYKVYSDLVLYGNSYVQVIKTKGGELHSLYHLPAPDMVVKTEFRNNQLFMIYEQQRPTIRTFQETEILHFKTPNPKSQLYGKPVFYPNLTNITIDENVGAWVRNFFQQGFSGGYIFEMEADEEVASRNRQIMKEEYTNPENAGKMLILEGAIKLVSEGQKFGAGMDFADIRAISKEDILQHAGVPLSMAGVRSDNGQANIEVIQTEQEAFTRNTIGHYHNIVFTTLKQQLFETCFAEGDLTIKPGLLHKFNNQNAIRISEAASKIAMTVNEFREAYGYMPIPEEFGGNLWVVATNNGVVSAGDIYGIDFNTGEKVKTLMEKSQEAQMELAKAKGTTSKPKKAASAGGTNPGSSLTNPTGR